jgi:dihydroxyacetone synthase
LGIEDVANIKTLFGLHPDDHFGIPKDVYDFFSAVAPRGEAYVNEWEATLEEYTRENPELAIEFKLRVAGRMPDDWTKCIPPKEKLPTEPVATRKSAGLITNPLGERLSTFLVGTADLTPSCNVAFNNKVDFQSVSSQKSHKLNSLFYC